ncbi:acetylornithine deacetylase/succinyl-diaminopimelate desuccinylase-like protein [Agromyces flavus]|uniref:Acetylornithine deacetylase/Succinyl-diaminopimelate desuccinylase n=1 Tax=Agromyces flavus TaxID=589382 RepID=A0A1H1ZBV5_9MICO|nr:M20/M25/M40 family metallo-hydrolase [Agromyces flavus]MCP2367017.1 acetylornithine deacetylase/succinyl-diaminopimelate desuccinylase-like protein [Agromyces flavus]GGI46566.1 peptidase [Agromyces flavus]SDT31113.1 Acetylornithine deacetylase/Succinyl-diaminopimelate desuccinylase [Agromyces flavus]
MDGATGAAAQLRGVVSSRRARFREELAEWVRIPSIAGDAERVEAVHRSAAYLAGRFREGGFPRVEVWSQADSAAVFAEWMARPDAPTVLVYSHHDVRAIRPELWSVTAPFEPLERDGLLFGRGASDAKGQVLTHLAGLAAHVAVDGEPAVNLRFLIDGEEELGSPHLATVMETHAADLQADLVLFSDTLLLDPDRPAVCTSVRGMIGATLTVHGPEVDVHSGTVSGTSPNPIHDLARVIAALRDDEGRLAVPGLEAPSSPDGRQRADFAELGVEPTQWVALTETSRDEGEPGWTVPERLWARPWIEVISVQAGDTEGLPRAVIPATATAELSIRLAGDQDPQEIAGHVERWVADRLRGIRFDLEFDHVTAEAPYRTPEHPAVDALAAAMEVGFEVDRVGRMGNGGGGPADLLARRTGAPVLFFGTGLPNDRWHAPDEHVRLDVLERGAVTLAEFWRRLPAAIR